MATDGIRSAAMPPVVRNCSRRPTSANSFDASTAGHRSADARFARQLRHLRLRRESAHAARPAARPARHDPAQVASGGTPFDLA
jgi:hypothetical protein